MVPSSFWGGFRQILFHPGVRLEHQQKYKDKGSCRRGAASCLAIILRCTWWREEDQGGFAPQAGVRGGFQRSGGCKDQRLRNVGTRAHIPRLETNLTHFFLDRNVPRGAKTVSGSNKRTTQNMHVLHTTLGYNKQSRRNVNREAFTADN